MLIILCMVLCFLFHKGCDEEKSESKQEGQGQRDEEEEEGSSFLVKSLHGMNSPFISFLL